MEHLLSAQNFVSILTLVIVVHVSLGNITLLIYLERKISAYIQDRIGPNRTGFSFGVLPIKFGFWGLGQSLADGLKFFLKEDYAPSRVDKALFTLAPIAIVIPALIGFAIVPWGGYLEVPDIRSPIGDFLLVQGGTAQVIGASINIGFLYLLAVASLGVYGITLGGWASNNKYSFLGGLRATAGMISYEIPLGASILTIVLLAGTVRTDEIVEAQIGGMGWFVLSQPLAALLFLICILAEANRAPFDNAEAEQELVGGYHTEYSSMRFALFFLAEYAHMITSSAILVVLFFGGYHLPFIALTSPESVGLFPALVKFVVIFTKVMMVVCLMMLIRWTIPRVRFDQVMKLAWGGMIPVSIGLVVATAVWVAFGWTAIWQMLLLNGLVVGVTIAVMPLMPKDNVNRRIPIAGSRFSPLRLDEVRTAPTTAAALREGA